MTPPLSTADHEGLELALAEARRAMALNEVPIGAVVRSRGGETVASAHNETVARRDPTAHAELLAIQAALRQTGNGRLEGATLYVTLEPCAQCAGAIVLSRVSRVVFGAWDPKAGMSGSIFDLLRHPRLNHQVEVLGGVLADPCGSILQQFFESRRERSEDHLHPRIHELLEYLDASYEHLQRTIDRIPPDRREVATADGRWSVAEIVQHVAIVEHRTAGGMRRVLSEARSSNVPADLDISPILGKLDVDRMTDRSHRIPAPAPVSPLQAMDTAEARRKLDAAHGELRQVIIEADGIDLSQVTMQHPVFGPWHLYRWIAFTGAHERRHAEQIAELG